jgi:hypothetical protein
MRVRVVAVRHIKLDDISRFSLISEFKIEHLLLAKFATRGQKGREMSGGFPPGHARPDGTTPEQL